MRITGGRVFCDGAFAAADLVIDGDRIAGVVPCEAEPERMVRQLRAVTPGSAALGRCGAVGRDGVLGRRGHSDAAAGPHTA